MTKLAIVSPYYNEQEVIRMSVERLTGLLDRMSAEGLVTRDSMIVLVNDGSSDATWQIISDLHQNHYVRGINLTRNVGHQNAIIGLKV
jgi:glycosyltransferase involved in cell wall biosynthesis